MEALILLMIGVIAAPILLIIAHSSKKNSSQPEEEEEPGIRITVGHSTEPVLTCPRCGSKHIDTLQRITGYLVGTTDRWNSGKLAELHDRVVHK